MIRFAAFFSALSLIIGSTSTLAADKKPHAWASQMRVLEKTMGEILTDVSNDTRFASASGKKRIDRNAQKLAKIAKELKKKAATAPDQDPSILIFADRFAEDASHAALTFHQGQRSYARTVLRSLTNYCVACHTRTNSGPTFAGYSTDSLASSLKGVEKANYFAAIRQFESAQSEYEKIVANASIAKDRPIEWESAVRAGLAIAVRVRKNPDEALKIVDLVLGTPKSSYFLKEQAAAWKKSILKWKAEIPITPKNEEAYHSEAVRLMAEAKSAQAYPADRSADVLYLRAGAAAHDLLSYAPDGIYAADGFYLAGLSYEVLQNSGLWDVHEFYYLACIYRAPHTEKARVCFRNYEESVYAGYTGSGGTFLPARVQERIDSLAELSKPIDLKQKKSPGLQ
jgi:hypothetical protein